MSLRDATAEISDAERREWADGLGQENEGIRALSQTKKNESWSKNPEFPAVRNHAGPSSDIGLPKEDEEKVEKPRQKAERKNANQRASDGRGHGR